MLSRVSFASLKSLRLAPSTASPIGTPPPSVSKLRFTPSLARSVGFGPVFFPSQRSFGHGSVHRLPAPVNAFEFVVGGQALLPQLRKHPGAHPVLKPPMGGGTAADARRIQCVPLRAGAQHEQNPVQRLAVGHAGSPAPPARSSLRLGQQRFDFTPQSVGHEPTLARCDFPHGCLLGITILSYRRGF